ncbi:MAG: hypothetical protein P9L89_05375 [Candidatus Celaenobacter polaris]|nr:hypothetical protein [Candidatus Celaenobacter polaris]
MTYDFQTNYAGSLHQLVSAHVPVSFIRDNSLAECACMDFCDAAQQAEIRYKGTADEIVDIAHELIHIRMQFLDNFPLLAWPTNDSVVTADTQDAVKRIRDAVDDTYVLHRLFEDTGQRPVSAVFYREIRKDIKQGTIRLVQGAPNMSRPLANAWRLRLADLSLNVFNSSLTTNQRQLAEGFLSRFVDSDTDARELFEHLRHAVTNDDLQDLQRFGEVLLCLRDRLGLPACLHLATRQRVNGR